MPPLDSENSAIGSESAAWLGRMITRVENSIDGLGNKIEGLERAIANDMKDMREGFRKEVGDVQTRVNTLEYRLAQVDLVNKILAVAGSAMLVGLIGMGVTRIWGTTPAPAPQSPPATQSR